ncbi:hypothetical protein C9J41_05935 [Photobacterium sp. GB-50]|uniref:tetratricopeptide repeat protein n=1 Tax=Photobacterium sp. GB-50 TaxID=2022107 RepID=UPI000D151AB3|nr:SEL1-like repeat protein [Photobacterium sp. GB-50]PSW74411.1 hypothetical protein C9J41_05935 [Photobacterium sp. GB-50]
MRKCIVIILLLMSCSSDNDLKNNEIANKEKNSQNDNKDLPFEKETINNLSFGNNKKFTIKEFISIIEHPIYSSHDKQEAINKLKELANSDSDAAYYLGHLYEFGEWVELSEEKARFYYKISISNDNHTFSQYSLALMLIDGRGGDVDLNYAEELLLQTNAKGHAPSTYTLGYLYFIKNNFKRCIEIFSVDDFERNEYSDYLLAISLINTRSEIERAIDLIERSAKKGHGYSHFTLGEIYQSGLYNKKKDIAKSHKHYQMAAKQNIPNAHFKSITLSIDNPFLIKNNEYDLVKALEKEDNKGNPDASFYLARIYDQGTIIQQNYKKALFWYIKSANLGNNTAMYNLASMYANGDGTSESIEKAQYWLNKAARNGNKKAIEVINSIN